MILNKQRIFSTSLICFAFAGVALSNKSFAIEPSTITSDLSIIQTGNGKLTACTTSPSRPALKEAICPEKMQAAFKGNDVAIKIFSNEQLNIHLANPNLVLFSYDVGKLEQQQTATAKELDSFLKAVNNIKFVQPAPAKGALALTKECDATLIVDEIDVLDLVTKLVKMQKVLEELRNASDDLYKGNTAEAVKKAKDQKKSIKEAVDILDKVQVLKQKLFLFEKLQVKSIHTDGTKTTDVQAANISQISTALGNNVCKKDLINQGIENLKEVVIYLDGMIQSAAAFGSLEKAIEDSENARPLLTSTISYSAENNQIQHFTISKNTAFDRLISEDAIKYRDNSTVGEFTVTVQPDQYLRAYPAVGMFYSFVRNPTFTATKNTLGQMVITQQTNDVNGVAVGLAMNFSTSSFDGEYFRPHLQLGVVPDKLAVLLGLGIDVPTTTASFDLGVIYQKVNELTNGQTLGQQVTSSSDITTANAWKAGLYISINYQLK
jgi:hypothetical protein